MLDYLQKKTNHKNICLGWLRIFYAYGPGQRQGSLIPFIIENLKNGELPPLKAPKNYSDYIHVDDIADLFSLSVSKEFPSGIYNVGSGKKTSVIEICKIAESVILNQQSLATALEEQSINSISDVAFYSSIKLTKSVFDWTPSTELKNGIEQTYQSSIYDQ